MQSSRLAVTPAQATVLVLLASICFGLVPIFARQLQAAGLSDAAIALYRYAFTAAVTLPFLPRERAKWRQGRRLFAAGLFMGLGWTGYLQLVNSASIAAAGVVYMSYPVFTILFAWVLVGHRPGWRAWAAALAVLLAAVLVARGGVGTAAPSDLLAALIAPISFGLIIVVLSAMVPDLNVLERTACAMIGAFLGLVPLALLEPGGLLPTSPSTWGLVLGLGLMTALVPQLVYAYAATRLGPTGASVAGASELPTMLVMGWLVFGEVLGQTEWLAAALVLAAVLSAPATVPAVRRAGSAAGAATAAPVPVRSPQAPS